VPFKRFIQYLAFSRHEGIFYKIQPIIPSDGSITIVVNWPWAKPQLAHLSTVVDSDMSEMEITDARG
jgi:hypothetical protein